MSLNSQFDMLGRVRGGSIAKLSERKVTELKSRDVSPSTKR